MKAQAILLLRHTLRANAGFSALSAFLLLLPGLELAAFTGLPAAVLTFIGGNLAVFSIFLFWLSARPQMDARWVQRAATIVALLDVGWVVGSVWALLGEVPFTGAGRWIVVAVAVVVAAFAEVQFFALWRLRRQAEQRQGRVAQ